VVIEDPDGANAASPRVLGQVQPNVHQALGCLGTITRFGARHPDDRTRFATLAGSIVPSHAYVHVEYGGDVTVHGMTALGRLIHADRPAPPCWCRSTDRCHEEGQRKADRAGGQDHRRARRRGGVAAIKAALKGR
jgi:hypothetical protein